MLLRANIGHADLSGDDGVNHVEIRSHGNTGATITATALEQLEQAASSCRLDENLLRASPVIELKAGIGVLLELLENVDLGRLLARQGMFSRLTGTDLEARYVFNHAINAALSAAKRLRASHRTCLNYLETMQREQHRIIDAQGDLDSLIDAARKMVGKDRDCDTFLRARFERRLSNLMAIQVSNITTIKQFDVTMQMVTSILDRFHDVEGMVLPVWESHALALAHSTVPVRKNTPAVKDFENTNQQLVESLEAEK